MHEISKWMPGRYTNWKVILRASGVILGHLNLEGLCESYFLVKHWSIFVTLTPLCWDLHPRGCHNLKWRTCGLTIFWFDPFKATKTTWIHFWPTVSVEQKITKSLNPVFNVYRCSPLPLKYLQDPRNLMSSVLLDCWEKMSINQVHF